MGLTTWNFPPVDPATFMQTPYRERTKTLARHWVEYGFGAPKIYVGGDVVTGANDLRRLVLRPRAALDPYLTGIPGVYLCSAATPPGAGANGMCGYNAATSALGRVDPGGLSGAPAAETQSVGGW
jgi:hypothetical protein